MTSQQQKKSPNSAHTITNSFHGMSDKLKTITKDPPDASIAMFVSQIAKEEHILEHFEACYNQIKTLSGKLKVSKEASSRYSSENDPDALFEAGKDKARAVAEQGGVEKELHKRLGSAKEYLMPYNSKSGDLISHLKKKHVLRLFEDTDKKIEYLKYDEFGPIASQWEKIVGAQAGIRDAYQSAYSVLEIACGQSGVKESDKGKPTESTAYESQSIVESTARRIEDAKLKFSKSSKKDVDGARKKAEKAAKEYRQRLKDALAPTDSQRGARRAGRRVQSSLNRR